MRFKETKRAGGLALVAVGAAAWTLCAGAALGQTALGDGRALDANLRVGSGGINEPVRDIMAQIRFQDAIVTGNAAFGRSFRGDVGYLRSHEFRGALGANDLFQFQRDAFSGGPRGGIRGTDALRAQVELSMGARAPREFQDLLEPRRFGGGVVAPRMVRSTSDFAASQWVQPSVVGYMRGAEDEMLELRASPLLGVRAERPRAARDPLDVLPDFLEPRDIFGLPDAPVGVDELDPERLLAEPGRFDAPPVRDDLELPDRERELMPGQIDTRALDTRAPEARFDPEAHLEIEPPAVRPSETPYDDIFARFREEREPGPAPGDVPAWREELERLRSDLEMMLDPAGVRPPEPDPEGLPGEDPDSPVEPDPMAGRLISPELAAALRESDTVVERLAVASGASDALYREQMDAAERLMGERRYFDAESRYALALTFKRGDPGASIGRVHAQLGGRLFLSAAHNLREYLTRNPELAAVRYGERLLPHRERLDSIVEQLKEHVEREEGGLGSDAALLLAYVGYQTGDRGVVRLGVDAFDGLRDPRNAGEYALHDLIASVWVRGD